MPLYGSACVRRGLDLAEPSLSNACEYLPGRSQMIRLYGIIGWKYTDLFRGVKRDTVEPESHSLEWIFFTGLIIVNGLLSLTETAIITARKAKLEIKADEGDRRAKAALELISRPEKMLLALKVGFLSIVVITGILVCTQFAPSIERTFPAYFSRRISLCLTALLAVTGLAAVCSLAAKIAAFNPEGIISRAVGPLRMFAQVLRPLVWLSDLLALFFVRFFEIRRPTEPDVIEEEVCLLLEQGAQDGIFEKAEQDMVERIFTLDDMRASSLMTPRTQIVWLDLEDDAETHWQVVRDSSRSRFPVGQGSLDDVAGVVYVRDLLAQSIAGQPLAIDHHIRTPVFVPKSMSALRILELFKQSGTHIALVIDEYGGVLGLITLNDILEHIVGDMPLAGEPAEESIVKREDGSWLVDGMAPVEELKELLAVEELPDEERGSYQTAGGFVISYLEGIPAVSEHFVWQDWRFEVLDMDRSRVDKILVSRILPQAPVYNCIPD